jgi:hypothetical protein
MLPMHFICGMGLEIDCTCFHGIMKCWKQLIIIIIISKLAGQVILYLSFLAAHRLSIPEKSNKMEPNVINFVIKLMPLVTD